MSTEEVSFSEDSPAVVDRAELPRAAPDGGPEREFAVIGIGASAGGLEALEAFFSAVPGDLGAALVLVQHLSPDFRSLMDELLSRYTRLPIHRVTDGMVVEPNAIYLIPPKKEMIIAGRRLLLTDKDPKQALALPIDTFFRSLAQDVGELAVGIILSGTGSDGSRGIRAIHEGGGLVIAQDERTAKFDGMPRSAVETGVVDLILAPQDMPVVLKRHFQQPRRSLAGRDTAATEGGMNAVFQILRDDFGIDFSHYKPNTIVRRMERRLQLNQLNDLGEYVARLRSDRRERDALYHDLLIGVTRFFRDPDAFAYLERDILPEIFARQNGDELRFWVAGCATGEEAYSFGIMLLEQAARRQCRLNARIFATDVHRGSLDIASQGVYRQEQVDLVPAELRERYFQQRGNQFQVRPELRKLVVFAPHNVIRDAPFTKLDMVSCRNLLIYLSPAAQRKAMSLFHFGLKAGGILFQGPSESPGEFADEFDTVDSHFRVYRKRRDLRLPPEIRLPLSASLPRRDLLPLPAVGHGQDLQLLRIYDSLLTDFLPPSLLLDNQHRLLHTFGGAGRYLTFPDGRTPQDALELLPGDLRMCVAGGLQRAGADRAPVVFHNVRVSTALGEELLRVTVKAVVGRGDGALCFLVQLDGTGLTPAAPSDEGSIDVAAVTQERFREMEDELRYTRENLQATIEELETSNEELQAANEELVAANEELQSTNEELHSVNEELYTVNAEYQRKITELTQLTDDMDNLLRATDVGTIFLDQDLRIRKFTPQITNAFQILAQDLGRRIDSFQHSILHDQLFEDVRKVLQTAERIEREVRDREGRAFLLRILPYHSRLKLDGAVISLVDITVLKETEAELRSMSKVFVDAADPILIENLEGQIVEMNAEAERAYGWTREELLGRHVSLLIPADQREAANLLRKRCLEAGQVRNMEATRVDKQGQVRPVLITASLLSDERGQPHAVATIAKDIGAQKQAELEAREAVRRRDQFLAMLSHELRNPLAAVVNAVHVMRSGGLTSEAVELAGEIVYRQTRQMARLLDDLLDVARVTQGKIVLRKEIVDFGQLLVAAVETVRPLSSSRRQQLTLSLPDEPVYVFGDPARLTQIQQNLLTNAIKYTPMEGTVEVRMEPQGNELLFRVQDNGVGIPLEMQERIFELFVQSDSTLDRAAGGIGVGLSLVKMLVEMHGGQVIARSAGPGQGSRFDVRLPRSVPPEDTPPVEPSGQPERRPKVLVIEDIADNRLMLKTLLELEGFEVRAAADGHSGLQALFDSPPDIALVDIGLPGVNGFEIARLVRNCPQLAEVRLVALTGYGREEDHDAILAAGFHEHLVKPVHPQDLTRLLSKAP